jgi:GNAT superfamily N-acetyltransferase
MDAALEIRTVPRDAIAALLPALAELRIAVFREFPYLYDGDVAYEREYLRRYAEAEGAVLVGAFAGERLVGASTGVPLSAEPDEVTAPFGDGTDGWFYFGESVLLPEHRGRGVGVGFFAARETHARALGFPRTCFCRVIRPNDHPRRPADYVALDDFWRRRGYAPLPGHRASMTWQDLDESEGSAKVMEFWGRTLP